MKDYQKAMLYLYPRLGRYAEDLEQYITAKALASSLGREDTETCVQTMIDCAYARDCCGRLQALLDGVLAQLTEEERQMLEYKYFRRKEPARAAPLPFSCSQRTYYRRQLRLESKLNACFLRQGMDEGRFERAFGEVPFVRHVYERIRKGREAEFVDKRVRGGIAFAARRSQK